MRCYPDDNDQEELKRLDPEPWMIEALRMNPKYVFWGPHEDYMWRPGHDEIDKPAGQAYYGWEARVLIPTWNENHFHLDDLNEVVNFYFEIQRPSQPCEMCAGKGSHPDAQWITESWYRHSSPFTTADAREAQSKVTLERFGCQFSDGIHGRGVLPPDDAIVRYGKPFLDHCVSTIENGGEWSTNLTQDEVQALVDHGRLRDLTSEFVPGEGWKRKNPPFTPSAEEVNRWARGRGLGHDCINAWICKKQRCERLGVPLWCERCGGSGDLFTGPAHLALILWVLHPRKGCSRGVEIAHIERNELPAVIEYLRNAAKRNADRFAALHIPTEGTV